MADSKSMLTKSASVGEAKPGKIRRVQMSKVDLKFVSENQQLEGFSGVISAETAAHRPNMDEISRSSKQFNAQLPSPQQRTPRPTITTFGHRK
jgi:hypothetical protein